MYIFNLFYLLHSYDPSFLICLCFNRIWSGALIVQCSRYVVLAIV